MKPSEALEAAPLVSPLTVLVKGVRQWTFPDGWLSRLFAQHAAGPYHRALTRDALFWLLVGVGADV